MKITSTVLLALCCGVCLHQAIGTAAQRGPETGPSVPAMEWPAELEAVDSVEPGNPAWDGLWLAAMLYMKDLAERAHEDSEASFWLARLCRHPKFYIHAFAFSCVESALKEAEWPAASTDRIGLERELIGAMSDQNAQVRWLGFRCSASVGLFDRPFVRAMAMAVYQTEEWEVQKFQMGRLLGVEEPALPKPPEPPQQH